MKLTLTNSATRTTEEFIPLDHNRIGLYVCGPTVYSRPHIGNLRSAVIFDVLFRILRNKYNNVIFVRNITDIDDKIIAAAKKSNRTFSSLTQEILQIYHEDMRILNCLPPTHEPLATEYIPQMIEMIQRLISQNHAYVANGHVLFDTTTYDDYGSLSNRSTDEMIAGARIEVAPYKKNPQDFVLWKPSLDPEEREFAFPSPWGVGRPGWHIECSAMSTKLLGTSFDIHGGGIDLLFPHHENEKAQSICAHNSHHIEDNQAQAKNLFAKYWLHNGFLTVNGEKMSKSLGNIITLADAFTPSISPELNALVLRYFFLTTHYRKPLDYNRKSMLDSLLSLKKIARSIHLIKDMMNLAEFQMGSNDIQKMLTNSKILAALHDDLNTTEALAGLNEVTKSIYNILGKHKKNKAINDEQKMQLTLYAKELLYSCEILGFAFSALVMTELIQDQVEDPLNLPAEILALINQREEAKRMKNWAIADQFRDQLAKYGYEVRDLPGGTYNIVRIL